MVRVSSGSVAVSLLGTSLWSACFVPCSVAIRERIAEYVHSNLQSPKSSAQRRPSGSESPRAPHSKEPVLPKIPLVHFDGAVWNGAGKGPMTMRVERQGETIYEGDARTFDFDAAHWHKEYMVHMAAGSRQCSVPVFVRGADARLCGTEFFSKPHLVCDHMPPEAAQNVAKFDYLAPRSDRGFSVEFEYVAQQVTLPIWDVFKREVETVLNKKIVSNHGRRITFVESLENSTIHSRIAAVRSCFYHAQDDPARVNAPCTSDEECAFSQYCLDCGACLAKAGAGANASGKLNDPKVGGVRPRPDVCAACPRASGKFCRPRELCSPQKSERPCPPVLKHWNWEKDGSVQPLTPEEAGQLGAGEEQTVGTPFETTAPGPPHVLSGASGMRAVVETLTTLNHIGTQAGPSQGLHVHVNVGSPDAPGKRIPQAALAGIWAAWAKYQLVIDEMMSPARIGNYYAKGFVLGDCELDEKQETCKWNPCSCIKRFFKQMHDKVKALGGAGRSAYYKKEDLKTFCNDILRLPGNREKFPCNLRYPNQRYFAVNLVALAKFGTLEFRAHSASFNPDRIGRWVQFLVAFIDYFGTGDGYRSMAPYFRSANWEEDYAKLQADQRAATADELFDLLAPSLDTQTRSYYLTREWEQPSHLGICHPPESLAEPITIVPDPNCNVTMNVAEDNLDET